MKINTVLQGTIHISKFSHDIIEEFQIDDSTSWLKEIIVELEEDTDDEFEREAAKMSVHATFTRKNDRFLGDHVVLRTELKGHYHLPCGRCLAPIRQDIDYHLEGAFLNETQEKVPEYQDVTTVFADGQEMELYFYHKNTLDVKEFYHEQLFTNMSPFPRCEGECRGQIYF